MEEKGRVNKYLVELAKENAPVLHVERMKMKLFSNFEVTVYPEQAQYRGKISMLVNPADVKTVKEILKSDETKESV